MMSCRLLVCLVFGLALQTAAVESYTTRMVRIFRRGGLANNDDTGHGNIMQEFSLGRFHRVARGKTEILKDFCTRMKMEKCLSEELNLSWARQE